MKWFHNPTSMDDVKKQYKALIRVYHPDNGGDVDKMKEINVEYNELCNYFEKGGPNPNNPYRSYTDNGAAADGFSNMIRPVIEQEMNTTISIALNALRLFPAIQSKYDKLIQHPPVQIYKDFSTVLKVTYEEMQHKGVSSQTNYQFINFMNQLESIRRESYRMYQQACSQYSHSFELEINDLYSAVGNTLKEQILLAKQNKGAFYSQGNYGGFGGYGNTSYPPNAGGCDDCCQCLGLMMCCDCIDCC